MNLHRFCLKASGTAALAMMLTGCGEPRAVLLPLQYPDGSPVTTKSGEPLMAGYQTYGSAVHANTTALYESARPPTCGTCARVGTVVTEPSVLRQATGVLETATIGAGAMMTGVGIMENGVGSTNITQNTQNTSGRTQQLPRDDHPDDSRYTQDRDGHAPQPSQPNLYSRTGWGEGRGDYSDGRSGDSR